MASGFTYNGVDFDQLFAPRTGAKGADVGFSVSNGQGVQGDISNRYQQAGGYGLAYNINFKTAGGVDLSTVFQDINLTAPVITAGMGGPYTFTPGSGFNPTIFANGPNLTFTWYQLGSQVAQQTFSGAGPFSASHDYGILYPGDSGTYSVTVSNGAGSDTSSTTITSSY